MLGLVEGIEILSDICGAASGFVLIFPTYRILTQRRALYDLQKVILKKYSNISAPIDDDVREELEGMKSAVDAYNPRDTALVMFGIWLIIVSFLLKIIYHVLTKFF